MNSGAWIVIVILVVLVGGVNLVAYGIVRGMFGSDNQSALNNLGKSLQKKDNSMDELRRKMEELEKAKKD